MIVNYLYRCLSAAIATLLFLDMMFFEGELLINSFPMLLVNRPKSSMYINFLIKFFSAMFFHLILGIL